MIKILGIGLWAIFISLGGSYLASRMPMGQTSTEKPQEKEGKEIVYIKTEMFSVPIIRQGRVDGYAVVQLSFAVSKTLSEALPLEPAPYLMDAALRSIYENTDIDFKALRPQDLTALSQAITEFANTRLGSKLVRDTLIQNINYVARDEVRTNQMKQPAP